MIINHIELIIQRNEIRTEILWYWNCTNVSIEGVETKEPVTCIKKFVGEEGAYNFGDMTSLNVYVFYAQGENARNVWDHHMSFYKVTIRLIR